MDLALDPQSRNVLRALRALEDLGLSAETTRVDEILGQGGVTLTNDQDVDLVTAPLGATFDDLWSRRMTVQFREIRIPVVSRRDQIRLLRASGRPQDLEDAEVLEALESEG